MLKCICIASGIGLLAITAIATILATGGFTNAHALTTIGMAVGVSVGAVAIGAMNSAGQTLQIWLIAIAMLCGETYNLAQTSERLIAQRDLAQLPAREAVEARSQAEKAINAARSEFATASTSIRLDSARSAKMRADTAVRDQAPLPGCAAN